MTHSAQQKLAIHFAAARYHLKTLYLQSIREESRRNELQRQLLCRLLRRTPYWLQGHLHLGMLEALVESRSTAARDTRRVARVRASAKAALSLLRHQSLSKIERKSIELQASFLQGMSHFLFREFEKAADFFYEVLDPTQADYVNLELGLLCMEFGGFTAITLGEEERALRYFEALPPSRQTPEVQTSLNYLRQKEAES